ncbi:MULTISPECIES: 30S ribosomal protein S6 [Candidatus Ichthyocystis]|uniref:Small ribosomal subunit protein bS6 n=1 Tax=Candidatus Ichthyocystis hellenicum TaxID=1561003 RepID=A0A0S4M2A7_9BURK|nr:MULTISPECIES: 30S ribosomal protein S6 [Ichthyocystis]CUT17897.1 30S ribosomal protein S6 [Candidatus Ichthyocystis hellenicum]
MRYYEVVLIVHPDQSEQVQAMVGRYTNMVVSGGGSISRLEDWGRRQLSYPVEKIHKAHYVLMNIECSHDSLTELEHAFRFNDAILRYLIVRRYEAVSSPSPMMKEDKSRSLLKEEKASVDTNTQSEDSGSAIDNNTEVTDEVIVTE